MALESIRGRPKAGKEPLDDEMLPQRGKPVKQETPGGGETRDTAGQHGRMAPESARGLKAKRR